MLKKEGLIRVPYVAAIRLSPQHLRVTRQESGALLRLAMLTERVIG